MFTAFMIDLVRSREYGDQDRNAIQRFLLETMDVLNEMFRKVMPRSLEFSAGDEMQGLFSSPYAAYLYYRMLRGIVSPIGIRAGIGFGDWSVQMEGIGTTAQDGTAYHKARQAIDSVKNLSQYDCLFLSGTRVDMYVNSLIQADSVIFRSQTENQRALTLLLDVYFPILPQKANEIYHRNERFFLLERIIDYKMHLDVFNPTSQSKSSILYDCDLYLLEEKLNQFNFSPKDSFRIMDRKYRPFHDTKIRGVPSLLAEVTGTKRQNIEKIMEAGNIIASRDMLVSLMHLMNEVEDHRI